MPEMKKFLGLPEALQAYRDQLPIRTVEALAKRIGVDPSSIRRWERGKNPDANNLKKIADSTLIPHDALIMLVNKLPVFLSFEAGRFTTRHRGRIRKINVTQDQLKALNTGDLGIAYLSGGYHLLAPEHVEAVRKLSAEHIPDLVSEETEEEHDYPVPDNLTW